MKGNGYRMGGRRGAFRKAIDEYPQWTKMVLRYAGLDRRDQGFLDRSLPKQCHGFRKKKARTRGPYRKPR